MRVLSIGTDRSVFELGSATRTRQKAYAAALGQLDLIVFTTGAYERVIDGPLTIIPTNSSSRWRYVHDAIAHARFLAKPDVVTAQDPFETGYAAAKIAREQSVPLHIQIHTDLGSAEFARSSLLNRIRTIIARLVLRKAARVRVVSERVRSEIVRAYGIKASRISVLPIFIDLDHFKSAAVSAALQERFHKFSHKVLIVSRFEPEKNIEYAIRAFVTAAPEHACLIVLGTGSLERDLIEKFRLEPNVFFEGQQDPAPYYKLCGLVLSASKYEGYGRTIIEALASERPVLATDAGVAKEAGAFVVSQEQFLSALRAWFAGAEYPHTLLSYPYASFQEYVEAYRADMEATLKKE